jgi:two-component system NtrC family response regulator
LVAKAIHFHSSREKGPFVTINCGAIPENLLESEFFGHEKGAFTGAHVRRKGKFELAHGGTLFLDEVGEISPSLQAKILRFLQDRKIERLGGRTPIELDVRVLAATNRDLKEMMKEGSFREDLYYRIGVINIHLPALRDRGGDIMLLARAFLQSFASEMNKDIKDFSREAAVSIRSYHWPGNVRELENKVKRAVIISRGSQVQSRDLGIESEDMPPPVALKEARRELDIRYIRQALQRTGGNISRAARELGISRVSLHDLINKYALR